MLPPHQITSLLKLEDLLEDLERSCDFEERVCLTLQAIERILPLKLDCENKDSDESHQLRKQADELFFKKIKRSNALIESWKLYSKSIAKAKPSSVVLAQSYANRSAVLFQLCKYVECINDINKALELKYPDKLRANLLIRKAKCLKLLNSIEAEKICEEAKTYLEKISFNNNEKEKLKKKICNINNVTKFKNMSNGKLNETAISKITINEFIPSASDSISIHYNKEFGKHLVSNRDIIAGEILINEIPYVLYIKPENIYTHCSHCLIRAWDSIPCENCVFAMYCSEKCKKEAWNQYHDIECRIKPYFLSMDSNDLALFSLKLTIIAVREAGSIAKLKEELEEIDYCRDYIKNNLSGQIHRSDKYKAIYSLLTHENDRKHYEMLTISLNAAFTMYFLYNFSPLLGISSDTKLSTLHKNVNAMFIGKIIAHNYMIIQLNNHEFNEVYNNNCIRIGSVIGSVTSLTNHSCNPNVARCPILTNNTVSQVVYALHPIKKGSQILDDYGCHFAFTPRAERKSFCDQYFFKCNCIACIEMWPLFEDLPSIFSILTNNEDKLEVSKAIIRNNEYKKTVFDVGIKNYLGSLKDILDDLAKSINTFTQSTSKPNREYFELLQQFHFTFIEIYGHKLDI